MAISANNPLTRGLSGMFGDILVFKTLRGKTILANRPRSPRRQSALQRENRLRFREAAQFAKAAMGDPQKKEYYWVKARKLKLPNAYTAAITDYMRKPVVSKIDVFKHRGSVGNSLIITAGKKEFALESVEVTLRDAQGLRLANSMAILKGKWTNQWVTTFPVLPEGVAEIVVTARDHGGNSYSFASFISTQ